MLQLAGKLKYHDFGAEHPELTVILHGGGLYDLIKYPDFEGANKEETGCCIRKN